MADKENKRKCVKCGASPAEHSVKLFGFPKPAKRNLIREHACLWDITSDLYKNRDMRQSSLQKIREEMQIEGFTVEDVKNKIKSMRSTYYLELDKIKKSSASGASGNVYQPKIKWFSEFHSFIRNVMVKRKVQENIESRSGEDADEDPATPGNSTAQPRSPTPGTSTAQPRSPTPGTSTAQPRCPTPEPSTPQPARKKSKIAQLSSIVNSMKQVGDGLMHESEKEDEFDIFGKHIATQLRKLSTEQATFGQQQIQDVVTKCRLTYSHTVEQVYSPASTADSQTTNDSLNLLPSDIEFTDIIMNAYNNA